MPEWSAFDFWDLWKAAAIGLTGAFGVMGLLTTYNDPGTGRITFWGKVNLAGIVLSAGMGVLSQLYDSQREARTAAASAQRAARFARLAQGTAVQAGLAAAEARRAATNSQRVTRDLLLVSRETRAIARGTERSVANSRTAAEAGQQAADATLGVARDTARVVTASEAGLTRVERLLSSFANPTMSLLVRTRYREEQPDCPEETEVAEVRVQIGRTEQANQDFDVTYKGDGQILRKPLRSSFCYFEIRAQLKAAENTGEVVSYLDLPGRTIFIQTFGIVVRRSEVERLTISTADGQFLAIPHKEAILDLESQGGFISFALHYTFPASRDPRTRLQPASSP